MFQATSGLGTSQSPIRTVLHHSVWKEQEEQRRKREQLVDAEIKAQERQLKAKQLEDEKKRTEQRRAATRAELMVQLAKSIQEKKKQDMIHKDR